MPRFGEAHKLLSSTHPDTSPPAGGADPDDGQLVGWSAALKAWRAQDPPSPGVTVHGLLDGLDADDHEQYALADKSRPDPWITAADFAARSIADLGTKDHGLLDGLTDDDHSIYALLSGRSGGQLVKGGLAASEHLTLQSTAHATRGYVRAQDDLQLLSNILRDSGGNNRLQLATSTPHLTHTGDTRITGNVAIAGAAVNPLISCVVQPSPYATLPAFTAVGGMAAVYVPTTGGGSYYGLNFTVALAGGLAGAPIGSFGAIYVFPATVGLKATVANMFGVWLPNPWAGGADFSATRWDGIRIDANTQVGIVDAYGVSVGDITGNSGFRRLLEVGPTVPYWRVVGGADAAAGLSNCYIKIADTLSQVRTRTIDGYTALTID